MSADPDPSVLPDVAAMFSLAGRTAIVTGGSRGIGRSIARGFAAAGADVVVSSRKADACEQTAAEIRSAGGSAMAAPAHMGRLDDITALVDATVAEFGSIDIIVNNAANPLMLGVDQVTPEAWSAALDTNLRGPVFLVQAALAHMTERGGSVINVLSNAAFMYTAHHLLYPVAKAGLAAATRSMAATVVDRGVRVNALVPGTIDTDMVRAMPEEFQRSSAAASLMRRAAHPDELIGMALLLASDAGSFMTGHTYFVDGGQSYH
jgi:NAD(P)-dependent dehydrogenase (short-subunit alcohol dehydrogenase family)